MKVHLVNITEGYICTSLFHLWRDMFHLKHIEVMKNKLLSFAMLVALSSSVPAKNTVTKIGQVTASVVLTETMSLPEVSLLR